MCVSNTHALPVSPWQVLVIVFVVLIRNCYFDFLSENVVC